MLIIEHLEIMTRFAKTQTKDWTPNKGSFLFSIKGE
jgi:hypothetical protein